MGRVTGPSGLDQQQAAEIAEQFGVAYEQVRRDHLISLALAALAPLRDRLVFFGGTALARSYLPAGRLSEDIDLLAVGAQLFAEHGPTLAPPRPWMFDTAPTQDQWREQLAGQTILTVTPADALLTVRQAWAAATGHGDEDMPLPRDEPGSDSH